jgi:hypothetical protein
MRPRIQEPASRTIDVMVHNNEPLHLPDIADEISTSLDGRRSQLRRIRPLVEPLLLVSLAGALFVAAELSGGRDWPEGATAPDTIQASVTAQPAVAGTLVQRAPLQRAPQVLPRLVAPATARPGEQITVVLYRDGALGRPFELRFDDTAVAHRIHYTASSKNIGWTEMFMTMDIPSTSTLGIHHIQFYGPFPNGEGGPLCGVSSEHQDLLGVAEVRLVA